MRGSEADMSTCAEGDMGIGFAIEFRLLWIIEDFFVVVCRNPAKRNAALGFDSETMHVRLDGADSSDMGERGCHAKVFFGGEVNPFWIFAQEVE